MDPGASGAIAVVSGTDCTDLLDTPTGKILVGKTQRDRISPELLALAIWELLPLDVVYIEEVTAMPKQGVSSVFTFGQAHGLVLGVFAAHGIRIVRVRPQTWQTKTKSRGDPRPRAVELYPDRVKDLQLVKHAGRADALLIAHYGQLMERGD